MREQKQPNGDRSEAGAPTKGSHEAVIALRKAHVKSGEVARVTKYDIRRVQQIWKDYLSSHSGQEWLASADGKAWLAARKKAPASLSSDPGQGLPTSTPVDGAASSLADAGQPMTVSN